MISSEIRPVITLIAAVILAVVLLIPIMRRLSIICAGRRQRFKDAAISDGRAVTAYMSERKRIRAIRDAAAPELRHGRISARYVYYVFPGGKQYKTKVFTGTDLPQQIQIYLYPGNPHRYLTEFDIQKGPSMALYGLFAYVIYGVSIVMIYRILGLFTL